MSLWAICSSRRVVVHALASASVFLCAAESRAVVYATREEALARAFPPPAAVARRTFFLTEEERSAASRQAQSKVESGLVVAYAATLDGRSLGTAYFDTHTVRTMPETLMVVVQPDGAVGSVDVLSFGEPEDYLPRAGWLKLFVGQRLGPDLAVGRKLAHVTGATLTTQAIASAVRRVLAVHAVLAARAK
jgi:hypothetical protein